MSFCYEQIFVKRKKSKKSFSHILLFLPSQNLQKLQFYSIKISYIKEQNKLVPYFKKEGT